MTYWEEKYKNANQNNTHEVPQLPEVAVRRNTPVHETK